MGKNPKKYRLILIVLILANMAFIFYNSSLSAGDSDNQSMLIAAKLAPFLIEAYDTLTDPRRTEALMDLNNLLRAIAHTLEFVPLGFLVYLLWADIFKSRFPKATLFFMTQGFCFLYAVSDEVHQILVAGRTFDWLDIAKDIFGVTAGIICALIVTARLGKGSAK